MTRYVISTWNLIYFGLVGPITISANNEQTVVLGLIIGFITIALDISYYVSSRGQAKD